MAERIDVLFICLHGSAKSLIAATHFPRLAALRGLSLVAASAGIEPDASIPPGVVAGLAGDGFDVEAQVPRVATAQLIEGANMVVAFGCDVPATSESAHVIQWGDLPAVSEGYDRARDAIIERLELLLGGLRL